MADPVLPFLSPSQRQIYTALANEWLGQGLHGDSQTPSSHSMPSAQIVGGLSMQQSVLPQGVLAPSNALAQPSPATPATSGTVAPMPSTQHAVAGTSPAAFTFSRPSVPSRPSRYLRLAKALHKDLNDFLKNPANIQNLQAASLSIQQTGNDNDNATNRSVCQLAQLLQSAERREKGVRIKRLTLGEAFKSLPDQLRMRIFKMVFTPNLSNVLCTMYEGTVAHGLLGMREAIEMVKVANNNGFLTFSGSLARAIPLHGLYDTSLYGRRTHPQLTPLFEKECLPRYTLYVDERLQNASPAQQFMRHHNSFIECLGKIQVCHLSYEPELLRTEMALFARVLEVRQKSPSKVTTVTGQRQLQHPIRSLILLGRAKNYKPVVVYHFYPLRGGIRYGCSFYRIDDSETSVRFVTYELYMQLHGADATDELRRPAVRQPLYDLVQSKYASGEYLRACGSMVPESVTDLHALGRSRAWNEARID